MVDQSDNPIRDQALRYAGWGWLVFPVRRNKVPLVKWKAGATQEPAQIEKWWRTWPDANVGIVTGSRSGIAVVDVDGPKGRALLDQLGGLPETLQTSTGRPEGGTHHYFVIDRGTPIKGKPLDGLELKADGQYVVGVGSVHQSGATYRWANAVMPVALPDAIMAWFRTRRRERKPSQESALGPRPAWLQGTPDLSDRATIATGSSRRGEYADVVECLDVIRNDGCVYLRWKSVGMAIWAALDGSDDGFELFEEWSTRSNKWKPGGAELAWREITSSPPTTLGMQSLIGMAREDLGDSTWLPSSRRPRAVRPPDEPPDSEADESEDSDSPEASSFRDPVQPDNSGSTQTFDTEREYANGHTYSADATQKAGTFDNPLIELNKKYAVIGDLGGKCLVMSWVGSKVDDQVKVPSFQSFKSFSERYANQYIEVGHGDDAEIKQLGPYWLKWTKRRSFEGLDLVPDGPPVLAGNVLNLWAGFAVEPRAGAWPLMQQHIGHVLASGDRDAAWYITKFAAWAVQHPGERAEVALVFRGDKGSGKGTFANALRRVFGQHGLQIFNSKHLVGSFNGHLRTCLLLFADEAFWAGDKQGESVLKGLITEQALMIEQKGVDAAPWRNRLHVIMAANADWVVPATRHERRYAVFDVSSERVGDRPYFRALHDEMRNGGLAAMLHDLLHLNLGDWHPRDVPHNESLRKQKELSLPPILAWWEGILQDGKVPYHAYNDPRKAKTSSLVTHAKEMFGGIRELNGVALGRYLAMVGCEGSHERDGNYWRFPTLNEARKRWVAEMGSWPWRVEASEWANHYSQVSQASQSSTT